MDDHPPLGWGFIGRRPFLIAAVAGCAALLPLAAHAGPIDGVAAIVARLQGLGSLDRASVERSFGIRLAAQASGNPYFDVWRGRGTAAGGVTVSGLELREPKAGAGATGRAFVALTLGGGCASRREVEQRFGPLAQSGVPRGRSLDEQTMLSRQERIGRLLFGFAERNRDCLRSITLAAS